MAAGEAGCIPPGKDAIVDVSGDIEDRRRRGVIQHHGFGGEEFPPLHEVWSEASDRECRGTDRALGHWIQSDLAICGSSTEYHQRQGRDMGMAHFEFPATGATRVRL